VVANGGDVVAHRAFHRWKRPAQRAVAAQTYAAPHNVKVALQTEMRFLRFQAPWAYGRKRFVLLRRTLAENWVNVRYRRRDVAQNRRIRGKFMSSGRPKTRNEHIDEYFFLH
jgi:hypothetical protein